VSSTTGIPATTVTVRTFTLVATGDIISHGAVAERADANVDEGWDYSEMFRRVRPVLAGADLALCHLESPLSMDDEDLSFSGTFRVPSSLADAIAGAGYDGCSLASNHALDSGRSSVDATLHHLRRVGLGTAGMADSADAAGPAWYEPGGIRVAHLSYTDLMNGRDLPTDPPWLVGHLDPAGVEADVAAAVADGAEFVIVSPTGARNTGSSRPTGRRCWSTAYSPCPTWTWCWATTPTWSSRWYAGTARRRSSAWATS
jgi:poly-gamma-glutamate synthesis protein (capsule biosynthesis protein)